MSRSREDAPPVKSLGVVICEEAKDEENTQSSLVVYTRAFNGTDSDITAKTRQSDNMKTWNDCIVHINTGAYRYQRLQLVIYSKPAYPRHLPASIDLRSVKSIMRLHVSWYPGLRNIDVSTLQYLESMNVDIPPYAVAHPPIPNIPTLSDLRITGVHRCIYLKRLGLFPANQDPYRIKVVARVSNLQELEALSISDTCANQLLLFEFGASASLKSVYYYDANATRSHYRSYRYNVAETEARRFRFYWKLAKAVCITLKHASTLRDLPIVKLWARGPMHHPSVIFDIARCFLDRRY